MDAACTTKSKSERPMQKVLKEQKIQISKFKANPHAAIDAAGQNPLAVMSHNTIRFYAVPVALYEQMMRDLGAVEE